jgi:Lrp/AsnC family leucine-responsive transcriptional regulator
MSVYSIAMSNDLSETDAAILRIVQQDARTTIETIAHRVGLSVSTAQRRLQRLREDKVIIGEVAVLDPKRIGCNVTMLVEIELERDRPELLPALHQWLGKAPEVQQAWSITGRGDYTLVVLSSSIEAFNMFMERMMDDNRNIRKFTTRVVLKTLKRGLAVPIA